ncbi:MAG: hypothetical protein ACK4SY_05880 [Pyrobaculum sp.]
MSVDDREPEKPLRRPPPARPPAQPPPPPYPQPVPPPPVYPQVPPVRTQRTMPPAPPHAISPQPAPAPSPPLSTPSQPATTPAQPPARRGLKLEKVQGIPLAGTVVALISSLFGVVAAVFSIVNEALSFPLLAVAIAGTNAALIIISIALWKLSQR